MSYERYAAMTGPARAGAALWRTGLGLLLAIMAYVVLVTEFASLVHSLSGPGGTLFAEFAGGSTPRGALLLLFSFALMPVAPLILARPMHLRSALSLLGPLRPALGDFLRVFRVLAILAAILVLLPVDFAPVAALPPGRWLLLLPLTLVAVAVQAGAEEIVFRGYLQTQLAARFAFPPIWLFLTALLFAYGHYAPAENGGNALAFAGLALAFGLAAGDLTARAGNLGPAVAFHLVNNFLAIAVIALPGPLSGLALSTYPFAADTEAVRPLIWVDLGAIGVSWLAARVALRL